VLDFRWEDIFTFHFRFQNSVRGVMDEVTIFKLIFIGHFVMVVTYQSHSTILDFTWRFIFAHISR
jgi:hypothetical protein